MRAYKRGNSGQIIANNEYSSEFRAKYFLYQNAGYAALIGENKKDFGWYVLLSTMWQEWLKERLTKITPIPERMELDYLFRIRPKFDSGSVKRGLCALNCACSARFSCNRNNVLNFGLVPFPLCFWAVGGRRENPEDPRRLLGAFNRTDAVAIPDAASVAPAILAEGSLPRAPQRRLQWLSLLSSGGSGGDAEAARIKSRRRRGELPALCRYRYFSLRFDCLGCSSACPDFSLGRLQWHGH
jgi:hypothetical protein